MKPGRNAKRGQQVVQQQWRAAEPADSLPLAVLAVDVGQILVGYLIYFRSRAARVREFWAFASFNN